MTKRDILGAKFGRVVITSNEVEEVKTAGGGVGIKVSVKCLSCGKVSKNWLGNLRAKKTSGCKGCPAHRPPRWLTERASAIRFRCTNPNSINYHRYGGRGIKCLFKTNAEMVTWILENLGPLPDRSMQIDRVDNDGNYEPGNLRWATPSLNGLNRCLQMTAATHVFRLRNPHVRFSDGRLARLVWSGMTEAQIVYSWDNPSSARASRKGLGKITPPDPKVCLSFKGYKGINP